MTDRRKRRDRPRTRPPKKPKAATRTFTKANNEFGVRVTVDAHDLTDGGTIVEGTDACSCGHAPEEHGRWKSVPGSTACHERIREELDGETVGTIACPCVCYEAAPEDEEG